ncbi:hypothetical protein DFJ74DRAFT_742083, partial [Hyaloraphidium curvatum]
RFWAGVLRPGRRREAGPVRRRGTSRRLDWRAACHRGRGNRSDPPTNRALCVCTATTPPDRATAATRPTASHRQTAFPTPHPIPCRSPHTLHQHPPFLPPSLLPRPPAPSSMPNTSPLHVRRSQPSPPPTTPNPTPRPPLPPPRTPSGPATPAPARPSAAPPACSPGSPAPHAAPRPPWSPSRRGTAGAGSTWAAARGRIPRGTRSPTP